MLVSSVLLLGLVGVIWYNVLSLCTISIHDGEEQEEVKRGSIPMEHHHCHYQHQHHHHHTLTTPVCLTQVRTAHTWYKIALTPPPQHLRQHQLEICTRNILSLDCVTIKSEILFCNGGKVVADKVLVEVHSSQWIDQYKACSDVPLTGTVVY